MLLLAQAGDDGAEQAAAGTMRTTGMHQQRQDDEEEEQARPRRQLFEAATQTDELSPFESGGYRSVDRECSVKAERLGADVRAGRHAR